MSNTEESESKPEVEPLHPPLDPIKRELAMEEVRNRQNMPAAIAMGAFCALAGASCWAVISMTSGIRSGWIAIGVGALVGYGVKKAGNGVDSAYGMVGAVFALLGCLTGSVLAACGSFASDKGLPFFDVLRGLDSEIIKEMFIATFNPMDLMFYGIAVYQGFKLSIRQYTDQELSEIVEG